MSLSIGFKEEGMILWIDNMIKIIFYILHQASSQQTGV